MKLTNYAIDFWEEEGYGVSKDTFEKEKNLLSVFIIPKNCAAKKPDLTKSNNKKIERISIKFSESPQSLFFFSINNQRFVGRKLLSHLCLHESLPGLFCSQVKDYMIMGVCEREQICEDGVVVFFRALENGEKKYVFNELIKNRKIDIYHPYTPLFTDRKLEKGTPIAGWDLTKERADFLSMGESLIREETIEFLSQFDLQNKIIFDPACSTGKFLNTIKERYPFVHTVGQDLSAKMVEYAKNRVDEIYCGDSINPAIKDSIADFVFFRFLNLEVVTTQQAYKLFINVAKKCKIGGYIILVGHTPILVSKPWLEMLGLNVLQCNAYSKKENSVFQYYVLKKEKEIKNIDFL